MQDRGTYVGATVKQVTRTGEEVHVRHGHGTYTYANSTFTYTGDWTNGIKHGFGTLTIGGANGSSAPHSVYEGTFHLGEMTGRGLKRWADGSSYAGEFRQGDLHGEGIYTAPGPASIAGQPGAGTKYEGRFQRNKRDGFGTLQCSCSNSAPGTTTLAEYRGEFADHMKHGRGQIRWETHDANGDLSTSASFDGTFAYDQREGPGVEQLADGSTYEGSFARDRRHGSGVFTHFTTGLRIDGEFERGRPTLRPTMLKCRVPKVDPAAAVPALPSNDSGRGSSREKRASVGSLTSGTDSPQPSAGAKVSPSSSKLSKKKQEELRRAADELASYRASLTDGFVQLEDNQVLPVIDEGAVVTFTPGAKLSSVFYLCACTPEGIVASSESGRLLRLTLQLHQSAPLTGDLTQSTLAGMTARTRANADAASELQSSAIENGDDPLPIVAFCTCPDARTVPWQPSQPSDSAESTTASTDEAMTSARRRQLHTKTPSLTTSKRRKSLTPLDPPVDQPPPPFVCDGACTRDLPREEWCTSLTRLTTRGFAVLDEVWLSGACTPGIHVDLVIEDITPGLTTSHDLTSPLASMPGSPVARTTRTLAAMTITGPRRGREEIGPPPASLSFAPLQPTTLKLLAAGVVPKRSKKATKKPLAAATAVNASTAKPAPVSVPPQ